VLLKGEFENGLSLYTIACADFIAALLLEQDIRTLRRLHNYSGTFQALHNGVRHDQS